LYSDLAVLKEKGLIEVEGGPKEHKTMTARLTRKGEEIASQIWNSVAPQYQEISTKVKDWIFPLDPNTIRERVHRDYPEYKKNYEELDED